MHNVLIANELPRIPVPDGTRIWSLMARELASPKARADSQVFPCAGCSALVAQTLCSGID